MPLRDTDFPRTPKLKSSTPTPATGFAGLGSSVVEWICRAGTAVAAAGIIAGLAACASPPATDANRPAGLIQPDPSAIVGEVVWAGVVDRTAVVHLDRPINLMGERYVVARDADLVPTAVLRPTHERDGNTQAFDVLYGDPREGHDVVIPDDRLRALLDNLLHE